MIHSGFVEEPEISFCLFFSMQENKAYMLQTDSGKNSVYCHMTSDVGECGGGGWTLVMKIDGSKV